MFNKYANSNLYLPEASGSPEQASYGFYLIGETGPAQISLDNSWNLYNGYYFFLPEVTSKLAELETALISHFPSESPQPSGLLWIQNFESEFQCITLKLNKTNLNDIKLIENTDLGFGTYQLPFFTNAPVLFNSANQLITIGYPDLNGHHAQPSATDKGIQIFLYGDNAGLAKGQVMINDFSPDKNTGWNVGLRYNMNMYTNLNSQYYPVFDLGTGRYIVFYMTWDALVPANTHLDFTGISFCIEKIPESIDQFQIVPITNANVIPSYWRTLFGLPVSLTPVLSGENKAQLVFQTWANQDTNNPDYYLAPNGNFTLSVTGNGKHTLLGGLAGTEFFEFTNGDTLSFQANNNAYTTSYPVVQDSSFGLMMNAQLEDSLLKNDYTTSWLSVIPQSATVPVDYYAAPQKASLFVPGSTSPQESISILDSYNSLSAKLTNVNTYYPMVPYAGITQKWPHGFDADDIEPFELQIIGAERRELLNAIQAVPPIEGNAGDTGTLTTTPQGLLALVNGLAWQELILGVNNDNSHFSFTNLSGKLRNAFQNTELFLVASNSKNLEGGSSIFNNAIRIEDWQFNVNIKQNTGDQHDNILICKFCKGTVKELVHNVNAWTDAADFNENITGTQTWMVQYFDQAEKLAESNNNFTHFVNLINDPNWNGILALKVDIDLGNFPDDLKGLLGAMDMSRFYAHHVGIQVNYVQPSGGSIQIEKSNLFGLVNYIASNYFDSENIEPINNAPAPVPGNSMEEVNYAYKVQSLQIVFANSAVTNFASKLSLTARKWFDEKTTLNKLVNGQLIYTPANYTVNFNGHYENHDGHPTYTFLTQKNETYQYFLQSDVLNYVEIIKAQFSTSSKNTDAPGSPHETEKVSGAFTFSGYMNFKELEGFDFLSFGSAAGSNETPELGLYYTSMALELSFDLDASEYTTSNLQFNFNPQRIVFDPTFSTIRQKSLCNCFPLSPKSVMKGTGNADSIPAKLGYIHVKAPRESVSKGLSAGKSWYGVNLEFHWGGPGALAEQAGFSSNLLLCWNPGGGSSSTEVLIKLPGMGSGEKLLSLQNILRLSIANFEFRTVTEGSPPEIINYNLLFNQIALDVMGLKLPPIGSTNLMLLGNNEDPGTIGWYGAYINK